MSEKPIAPPEFKAFHNECRADFCGSMDRLLTSGISQQIPGPEIAFAIVTAAMRCAAMAIVGGQLDPRDYDKALVDHIQSLHAARQRQATGNLQ